MEKGACMQMEAKIPSHPHAKKLKGGELSSVERDLEE